MMNSDAGGKSALSDGLGLVPERAAAWSGPQLLAMSGPLLKTTRSTRMPVAVRSINQLCSTAAGAR